MLCSWMYLIPRNLQSRKADLIIYSYFAYVKKCNCNISRNKMDFAGKVDFTRPNYTYSNCHEPHINMHLTIIMYVYITAGTLVMIRLHKKALTAQKIEKFMRMKISFDM